MFIVGIPVHLWLEMDDIIEYSSEAEGDISLSPIAQGNQVCM